jgi:hypothetical protein
MHGKLKLAMVDIGLKIKIKMAENSKLCQILSDSDKSNRAV